MSKTTKIALWRDTTAAKIFKWSTFLDILRSAAQCNYCENVGLFGPVLAKFRGQNDSKHKEN